MHLVAGVSGDVAVGGDVGWLVMNWQKLLEKRQMS